MVLEEATEEDKAPESSVNVVGDNSKENNNETVNDKIVPKPALNSNSCGDSKKVADVSEKPRQAQPAHHQSHAPVLWPARLVGC